MKFMEKYKETIKSFKGNKDAIKDSTSIYNKILCKDCKRKLFVKFKVGKVIKMRDYCLECQNKIKEEYGDKYV